MSYQYQPLLQTKLHRPRLPHDLVFRQRLTELLNHSVDRPLTLICAPAGFGKTTLIATWIERIPTGQGILESRLPTAWYSLDDNDNDLTTFLRYFIASLQTIFENACQETLVLLQALEQPPLAVVFTTLSNELEKFPEEFILVLDDYHTIHNMEIHNLLAEFIRFWPSKLHLILISRISPSLPLDQFRAKGMLNEIRSGELRFSQDEIFTYLSQTQFALMGQNAVAFLDKQFEGWPAGLHLAALSLRSARSQESVLKALSSENQNITRYMVEEVLNQQVPPVQSFLLRTSILDRFNAALCEAIIGKVEGAWNARACLDWIDRSEMFITALDDRKEWYRYHHLFQELLQQRLLTEISSDQVNLLHHLASAWFEEHGFLDESIRHALAAGDVDLAARLMAAKLCEVLNREDRPTLERWLRLLPEEVIQRRPDLLMIRAWALQFLWQLGLQVKVLQQVEELLDSEVGVSLPIEEVQILRAQILLLKSQYMYFSNQMEQAFDMCREVLTLLPPRWSFARGSAMLYLGFSMQAMGRLREAETLILAEFEQCIDKTEIYPLILLQTLGFIYLLAGNLEQTMQIGQTIIQGAIQSGILFTKSWGDYYLGVACYLRNDLEAAHQYFTQINNNRYLAHFTVYRDAVAGLALIHQIKGESAEAWQLMEAISRSDLEETGSEDSRTRSLRARLQLMQGDLESARRWAGTFSDPPPDQPLMFLEEPQVTRVRVLLASNTDTDRVLALQVLDTLDEIVDRTHNTRYKIELLAMRAIVLEAQGKTGEAESELLHSVELAQSGGFIKVFIDLGKPLEKILTRLTSQSQHELYISRLLAAFQVENSFLVRSRRKKSINRELSSGTAKLDEALTPRELEVLNLLRGPASIKEIARQLNITYATAKRHTINVYSKLGVNQRWNAVARAEELNILPPK